MLIRRPVADVFAAFADPAITTRFWFTDSTGPLGPGAKVEWTWAMYAASADVTVRTFGHDERIVFDWDGGDGASEGDWRFTAESDELTRVEVTETSFAGDRRPDGRDGDRLHRRVLEDARVGQGAARARRAARRRLRQVIL